MFALISEDLLCSGSGKSFLVGDDSPHVEMQRGRGDAGGCLTAAPGIIRPGEGLLKSQWWKTGRAQVVAVMWAPS